jgi:transcriptional regulator PpsR
MKRFEAPLKTLGGLDAEAAGALIAAAADIALIIDREGVIQDTAFGGEDMTLDDHAAWVGKSWADTVSADSRSKVEALLRDASAKGQPKSRHVNYPSSRGADVPILYSAIQIGREGKIVAVGRDLRSVAALQQRLVDAQQSMERDYWRFRQVETRYRLLFQRASEAVVIVDSSSLKVLEANPAAGQLLGETARTVVGRAFLDSFDAESAQVVSSLLAGVMAASRADDIKVHLAGNNRELLVSASLFRQDNTSLFLVRLSPSAVEGGSAVPKTEAMLLKVIESAPDGFVVTDPKGLVLSANTAFLDLVQLSAETQARGESIERWLGRPGVDMGVLLANLRQHGSVRLFPTTMRGAHGSTVEVEISAVSVPRGDMPCMGFMIRNVGWRLSSAVPSGRELPRSVEQLTELVGRVPLKDLVQESTDLIEKLCIEAALELTRDNRASAAEMLGLSRQSLYVKLRRFGLGDLGSDNDK